MRNYVPAPRNFVAVAANFSQSTVALGLDELKISTRATSAEKNL